MGDGMSGLLRNLLVQSAGGRIRKPYSRPTKPAPLSAFLSTTPTPGYVCRGCKTHNEPDHLTLVCACGWPVQASRSKREGKRYRASRRRSTHNRRRRAHGR